jgi:histone H3/H4
MSEIAILPMERILRKAGAERVSAEAARALAEILEDVALDIATQAVAIAHHAKRKTVMAEDVKLAAR